jgi:mannose/cellobiose epimerase-like protein (N-acyl-D-glucosamine 2-epimerase family)
MTRKMLEQAFDKDYGGIFNVISDGEALHTNKKWWIQAEAAIA